MATNSPYRTSSDLILAVLKRGGVLAVGQAVDPEDYQNVANDLDSIIRKLAALEIVYVSDQDNIPGAWFSDLVDIVLGECAASLGFSGEALAALVAKGLGMDPGAGAAAKSLKIIARGKPTYEIQRIMNF